MCYHAVWYLNIGWTQFGYAIRCMSANTQLGDEFGGPLDNAAQLAYARINVQLLEDIAYDARWSECSDPKDKLFGFIGLLHRSTRGTWQFEPDYTIPTREAYINATSSYIISKEGLNVLRCCDPSTTTRVLGLPSWVPRWDCLNSLPVPLSIGRSTMGASASLRHEQGKHDVLNCKGLISATIQTVLEFSVPNNGDDWLRRNIQKTEQLLQSTITSRKQLREMMCRTFVAGRLQDIVDPPSDVRDPSEVSGVAAIGYLMEPMSLVGTTDSARHVHRRYLDLAAVYCQGRSSFIATDGQLGIGPRTLKQEMNYAFYWAARSPSRFDQSKMAHHLHMKLLGHLTSTLWRMEKLSWVACLMAGNLCGCARAKRTSGVSENSLHL